MINYYKIQNGYNIFKAVVRYVTTLNTWFNIQKM
jgi:hypothetical protein